MMKSDTILVGLDEHINPVARFVSCEAIRMHTLAAILKAYTEKYPAGSGVLRHLM